MPRWPSLREKNNPLTDRELASSNSTANTFVGGRRPSWMEQGTLVKPSTRVSQLSPSTAPFVDATVLPSPAPSDEPSPAISNPQDSPYMSSAHLPEAQSAEASTTTMPSRPPGTDVRFVIAPSQVSSPALPQNGANGTYGPVFGGAAGRIEQPSQRTSPHLDHDSQSRKRRRVGRPCTYPEASIQARRAVYTGFIQALDAYVVKIGGEAMPSSILERPRFQLVKEACTRDDGFFLALHQVYCMWSLSTGDVHRILQAPPEIIDFGMGIIEQVLKKNDELNRTNLDWFSVFPGTLTIVTTAIANYAESVTQVGQFLQLLARNWHNLMRTSHMHGYPYLMDEMVGILGCISPVLQGILFTASRRRLGVMDGHLSQAMDQLFREDQAAHRKPDGTYFAGTLSDMNQRNQDLIQRYSWIVQQAQNRGPAPSPQLQNQQQQYVSMPALVNSNPQPPAMPQSSQSPRIPTSGTTQMFAGNAGQPSYGSGHAPLQNQQPQPMPHVPGSRGQAQSPSIVQGPAMPPSTDPRISPHLVLPSNQHSVAQYHRYALPTQQAVAPQAMHLQNVPNQYLPYPQPQPPVTAGHMNPHIPPRHLSNASMTPVSGGPVFNVMSNPAARQFNDNGYYPQPTQNLQGMPPAPPLALQAPPPHPGTLGKQRLFPPVGFTLPRSEWPYDTNDRKSLIGALHQANLRSPKRIMRQTGERPKNSNPERYYQSIKRLAIGPTPIPAQQYLYEFEFHVSEADMGLLSKIQVPKGALLPQCDYFDGALRYRLRCVMRRNKAKESLMQESEWATMDTWWPPNIFVKFNSKPLSIRRHTHNGKDLPVEITQLLQVGRNTIQVAVPLTKQPLKDTCFVFGVDVIETVKHSTAVSRVWEQGFVEVDVTLDKIKTRLSSSSSSDDGISIQQKDLSVDLADPFSAKIFDIPARGCKCTHMECFDLDNWLNTRPTKPAAPKCQHRMACSCRNVREPSVPDKWKCPICHEDARPGSLRIDGFLLGVRKQLEKEKKLRTKSMLVAADGTWKPAVDNDDDDESDGEGTGIPPARNTQRISLAGPMTKSVVAEVIELLDDD